MPVVLGSLWQPPWTDKDTDTYVELKLKWEWNTHIDRAEDLQYRMLSVINDLQSRGHAVIMFNQSDDLLEPLFDDARLRVLTTTNNIVESYRWRAIKYQHDQNVPSMDYGTQPGEVPDSMKHRMPGYHSVLNEFLADYIARKKLVQ